MATAKCNRIDARIASNRVRRSRFRSIKRMAERRTRSTEEASLAPSSHHASAEEYRSGHPRTNQELSSSRANARDLTKVLSPFARSYAHNETSTAARNHRARQNKSLRTQPASSRSLWTLP